MPLFGYRRKSYLILASLVATGAYLLAAHMEAPSQLLFVLLLTAYAMAIASTLCGALLVENGQRYASSGWHLDGIYENRATRPELQGHPIVRELNGPIWWEEGECVTYEEREL